jgi:hypothetical protein
MPTNFGILSLRTKNSLLERPRYERSETIASTAQNMKLLLVECGGAGMERLAEFG